MDDDEPTVEQIEEGEYLHGLADELGLTPIEVDGDDAEDAYGEDGNVDDPDTDLDESEIVEPGRPGP